MAHSHDAIAQICTDPLSSRQVKPAVYVTYNGDFFDWPFIETRAAKLGMAMHEEIGFRMDTKSNTCLSK